MRLLVYNVLVKLALVIFFGVLLLAACGDGVDATLIRPATSIPTPAVKAEPTQTRPATPVPTPTMKQEAQLSQMSINVENRYVATINTTKGSIVLELFAKEAPITVNNFVVLARTGFYNGVIFHRVIQDFMIQAGNAAGTESSKELDYTFEDEFHPSLSFDRPGRLAMGNRGPNTNGSHIFITITAERTSHLTGAHTIFGQVLEGQDVVDVISLVPTGPGDTPLEPVVIQGIEIEETAPTGK